MALTVEQLVSRRQLATRVIAGGAGVPRTIGWAHACEMADPWSWIGEGDLLMTTGLGVPAEEDAQVEYIERLAAVGAAGVAIGEDMEAPPLRPAMLDAADRCSLPLMLTRYEIPFIALARAVIEANNEVHLARIQQTEDVYEVLRRSSTEGLDLAGLVTALSEVVGCGLCVVDPSSAHRLAGPLPDELLDAVHGWAPGEHDEAPVRLDLPGAAASAVLVPSPRPTVLVALSGRGPLLDSTVLRHMAAAVALQQTRQFADRERSLRLGATLLSALLDQRIGTAIGRNQLAAAGLGDRELALVLAACAPAPDGPDLHLLHHQLADLEIQHLMLHRPPLTYVLLPSGDRSAEALAEALPSGAGAGISDTVTSPAELPAAERQARWALHRAQERRLRLVHHSDDLGDSLFLPGDRDDSRAAARRVLGAVLEYDAANDAHLMDSLRVFLQENRSWQRAAERLHVHKQTLVYRVRRIEELTSRRLSDTADVAELWLGLQAATASGLVDPDASETGPSSR